MPCRGPDEDYNVRYRDPDIHRMKIQDFEATLCAVLSVFVKQSEETGLLEVNRLLDRVDWTECGVPRKRVETWWKKHQAEDEKRRKREDAEKRKAELKKIAIGKLTAEELEVLGIKL